MLMFWYDICALGTSRKYVEYLSDITEACMRGRHFVILTLREMAYDGDKERISEGIIML